MGNCFKSNNRLSHIDDSVKVMIRHDTKALEKKGQKPGGYVPRAPHPILDKHDDTADATTADAAAAVVVATEEGL